MWLPLCVCGHMALVVAQVVFEAIELDGGSEAVQSYNDPYERRYMERGNGEAKMLHPPRPGSIDNSHLILPQGNKVRYIICIHHKR